MCGLHCEGAISKASPELTWLVGNCVDPGTFSLQDVPFSVFFCSPSCGLESHFKFIFFGFSLSFPDRRICGILALALNSFFFLWVVILGLYMEY